MASAIVVAPAVAWACSCGNPELDEVLVGEQLPANVERVLWVSALDTSWPGSGWADVVGLERLGEGGAYEPVELEARRYAMPAGRGYPGMNWLTPKGGFVLGGTYRFVGPGSEEHVEGGGEPLDEEFVVVDPVEGLDVQVRVGEQVRGLLGAGDETCVSMVDSVHRSVSVSAPELQKYGAAVAYELWVDGAFYRYMRDACEVPRFGGLGHGHHEAIVAVGCDADRGSFLQEGPHTLQVRARLTGTDVTFESEPASYDLTCGWFGGGGCAQGGGRAPAPLGWLGLSVALGWFVRRRG
jgi:hypothetical protein